MNKWILDDHGEVFVAELKAESIYFMWKLGTLVRPKDHTEMLYTLLNNMPILLDLDVGEIWVLIIDMSVRCQISLLLIY